MAHDVFISYSSKDKPVADAVCFELEAAGIRCWMAPRDILPGQHWGAAIIEAINASKIMVLVLSAHANASEQVLREVERSVHRAIPIIPFRIEEFELASAFEYFLSVPHWLDAMNGPLEEHIQRLVHTTQVLLAQQQGLNEPASPAATAPSADVPNQVTPLAARLSPQPAATRPTVQPARPAPAPVRSNGVSAPQASAAPIPRTPTPIPMRPRRRPAWIWAIPTVVVVLLAVVLVMPRLLPSAPVEGPNPGATGVVAANSTSAGGATAPALPATQPPQPRGVSVQVTSSVEGATILVNGSAAGRTPQTLSLQPGQYELTLQAASYRDWSQTIQVNEGQSLPVQAILEPLPPIEVLEVTDRVLGRDAAIDTGRIVRIRNPGDTFQVSDVVNAVVYFRPKTFQIRDISYNVTHRWQIAGEPEPGVVAATSRGPREEPLLYTHACALAAQLDPRGTNTPLSLEILVDGESVARFTFRITGGNLANAPQDPVQACDRTRLPNIVVMLSNALAPDDVL